LSECIYYRIISGAKRRLLVDVAKMGFKTGAGNT
jgi:hypothetical protein